MAFGLHQKDGAYTEGVRKGMVRGSPTRTPTLT